MTHSEEYMWVVAGVASDGTTDGIGTTDEAAAVSMFWTLANTHPPTATITFYANDRTLWLDDSTPAVRMSRVDLRRARRRAGVLVGP